MTAPAANVITALAAVQLELGGIQKLTPEQRRKQGAAGGDERGVTYAYRGVDQIAAAAQPLFGKHGVVIVPTTMESTVVEIALNGRPWSDRTVRVTWTIYGPGGVTDCITAVTEGIGRDNSDKGANKALTGAYKNLLLRLLTVGDPADDTDGHTHEADPRPAATPAPKPADPVLELSQAIANLDDDRRAYAREVAQALGATLNRKALAENTALFEALTEWVNDGAPLPTPEPAAVPKIGDLITEGTTP